MAGYANRVITLSFPELAEDGDHIEVIIRNPKRVPLGELQAWRKTAVKAGLASPEPGDGGDDPGEPSDEEAEAGTNAVLARLVIGWHAYDASFFDPENPDADQPLLPLPATPELVAKLPLEILTRLADELGKAFQGKQTEPQEAGTTTPS